MAADRPKVEMMDTGSAEYSSVEEITVVDRRRQRWIPPLLIAIVAVLVGWSLAFGSDDEQAVPEQPNVSQVGDDVGPSSVADALERLDAVQAAQSMPRSLVVAELFAANPSGAGLRDLFEVVGGLEGLALASSVGPFDLVRFDPFDHNRLLASARLSYGEAQNQLTNEIWTVSDEGVDQSLWNSTVSHDFAHFNADGTMTMWVHGGGDGFAPRTATILSATGAPSTPTDPIYASRFTVDSGTVFALTGNGDYYTNEPGYVDLIAATGIDTIVLADGSRFEWIDNPTPGLLIAYSSSPQGLTAVWDAVSLQALPTHPLSGRPYRRVAFSADQQVAVAVTAEGALEIIDPVTGRFGGTFGEVDIEGVDQPITLNHDGTVAVTVERSGLVRIWWVGDDTPVASANASATQPRWVAEESAPMSASAVAADATRIALRMRARIDVPTHWDIVDSDVESWIQRACDLAGRTLSDSEARALGLSGRRTCVG